jgi:hypothetical protein
MIESRIGLKGPLRTLQTLSTSRSRLPLIVYAGKPRSGGNASKQKGNKKPAWTPTNASSKPKMQNLAGEEILLFDSVAPSKDALRVSPSISVDQFHFFEKPPPPPPPPRQILNLFSPKFSRLSTHILTSTL